MGHDQTAPQTVMGNTATSKYLMNNSRYIEKNGSTKFPELDPKGADIQIPHLKLNQTITDTMKNLVFNQ